ncbi:MAG: hypothetical protein AAB739_04520 [Patescibacteria group bacterium]
MKNAPESPDAQKPIDIQDLFPNLPESMSILALVGILQLQFHHLFEQFRENKIEAKTVHERVGAYIDSHLEIFTQLFGRDRMDRMTSANNFYKAFASLLLKPAELPNPVRQFFIQYIGNQLDFDEEFFVKTGAEAGVGKSAPQQSSDTIHSPKSLKRTLKILKSKIPKSGQAHVHYEMLKKIAGGDEKAEKTLDWLLVKTTLDVYGMPTTGFKPEHLPVPNTIEKLIELFRKIPGLNRFL